jgi:hypothetical protein
MWESPEFGWMLTPDLGVHGDELQQPIGFLHDFFASKRRLQASPRGRARPAASVKTRSKAPRRRAASASNNRRSRK